MIAKEQRTDLMKAGEESLKSDALHAIGFVRRNLKALAVAAGSALLVVLVVAAYTIQKRQGEAHASRMLLNAVSPQQQETILSQYPDSSSAPAALLALASGAYHAGAYDQAYDYYVQFEKEYADHAMAPVAKLGKIMCNEGRGQTALALEGFSEFAAANPGHFLAAQALFGKTRCLQAVGRRAEAKSLYEDFISSHPESGWTPVAESSLVSLEREERK